VKKYLLAEKIIFGRKINFCRKSHFWEKKYILDEKGIFLREKYLGEKIFGRKKFWPNRRNQAF